MKSLIEIGWNTLVEGRNRLTIQSRESIASYIKSQEVKTGGFQNKGRKPDLYYTFFGLTVSLLLKVDVQREKHEQFLKEFDCKLMDLPHYVAYTHIPWLLRAFSVPSFLYMLGLRMNSQWLPIHANRKLELFTEPNFRVPLQDPHTPYSIFLRMVAHGFHKNDLFVSQWRKEFMSAYQTPEGGWSNLQGGTPTLNATVSGMMILYQLGKSVDVKTIEWLKDQQHTSGGFMAVPQAPLPDLLSTATALLALKTCNVTPRYPATEFIQAHWCENGGFSATFLDDSTDCEYTFYGLLAVGASNYDTVKDA